MKHLYVRCNGGHYFRGSTGCPLDGWGMAGVAAAAASFAELQAQGGEVSIERLAEMLRPNAELLRRLLIIDFGDASAAFQALAPEYYLHDGKQLLAHEVGPDLY